MKLNIRITPGADGTVGIGGPTTGGPEAPAGVALVGLRGVTLMVDPTDAKAVPHATVFDLDQARLSVEALYGALACEALESREPVDVPLGDLPGRDSATQLGLLLWLAENRPLPLDSALVDLEAAVHWAGLADDDEGPLESSDRLTTLAEMARRLRETSTLPLADELRGLFARAATLVDRGREDDSERVAFAHERAMLQVERRYGASSLQEADLTWLDAHMRPTPAPAMGACDAQRRCSINWLRVPSALLPAGEDTVRFEIVAGPPPRVHITIPAPEPARPHPAIPRLEQPPPRVVASLRSYAWPVPLADAALSLDTSGRVWTGTLPLSTETLALATGSADLDVDVRAERVPWTSPSRRRVRMDAAQRWAARGLALSRLQDASGATSGAAEDAFRYAARLWAPYSRATAERCLALATTRDQLPLTLAERWFLAANQAQP
jgi:hypothetical protein